MFEDWFLNLPLLVQIFKDLPLLSGCPLSRIIGTGVVDSDSGLLVTDMGLGTEYILSSSSSWGRVSLSDDS